MRKAPIRHVLMTRLVAVVVLLGGTIWAVTYWTEQQLVRHSCAESIQLQLRLADQRLQTFFSPVMRDVELTRELGEQGVLDIDKPRSLESLLAPLLRENPHVYALMIADERGHEFYLTRSGSDWSSRQTRRDEAGHETLWRQWSDENPLPQTSSEQSDYDPRKRPWFREAIARGRRLDQAARPVDDPLQLVHWTKPYRFFRTQVDGITAAARFHDREGRESVVAFDVLLSELSDFRRSQRAGRHGHMVFLDDDGWPVDAGTDRPPATTAAGESVPPPAGADFDSAEIAQAVQLVGEVTETNGEAKNATLRFIDNGRTWWVDAKRFALTDGQDWRIVVVVPESDFIGRLGTIRLGVAALTFFATALAVVWALTFSRRISRPIETLVRQNEEIARGNFEESPAVVSPLSEIQELAGANQRMRLALRSLVKIERDFQIARQIQQNTLPQRFPQVPGFQIAGWSEPADATGGDTFDVVSSGEHQQPGDSADSSSSPGIYMLLADASGHGIGPALCAMQTQALFRVGVEVRDRVDEIARLINHQLSAHLPDGRFVTAWMGKLNPRDRTLFSFSAGQGPLLWYHAISREVEIISDADDAPFGIAEDGEPPAGNCWRFEKGDLLAVLSDGIYEAAGPGDELFGTARAVELLCGQCDRSADQIATAIREAVADFAAGIPPIDDQTALIVKCVGD